MWSDMHTHKGKRQPEKQTFAITSDKYGEMFEKKRLAKDAEEKEVQKQRRIIIIIIIMFQNVQLDGNFSY
jgi:hypothetical protein